MTCNKKDFEEGEKNDSHSPVELRRIILENQGNEEEVEQLEEIENVLKLLNGESGFEKKITGDIKDHKSL